MNESPYERALTRTAGDPGKTWRIVSREELRQTLERAMDEVLLPRERFVLYCRYGCWDGYDHTIAETAEMLGVSKTRIVAITRNALKKLRRSKYSALVPHFEGRLPDNVDQSRGSWLLDKLRPGRDKKFTPMETKVLDLVGKGLTNEEISIVLFISKNTARSHIKRIYAKTEIKNRVKLALFALERREDR